MNSVYAILFGFLFSYLAMMILPSGSKQRAAILERDLTGLVLAGVSAIALVIVLILHGYQWEMALSAAGLGLGILMALPAGITEKVISRTFGCILAILAGLWGTVVTIHSYLAVPWNNFWISYSKAYAVFSNAAGSAWAVFVHDPKWGQMTPMIGYLGLILIGTGVLLWLSFAKTSTSQV